MVKWYFFLGQNTFLIVTLTTVALVNGMYINIEFVDKR